MVAAPLLLIALAAAVLLKVSRDARRYELEAAEDNAFRMSQARIDALTLHPANDLVAGAEQHLREHA